jgi:hypothetical protein
MQRDQEESSEGTSEQAKTIRRIMSDYVIRVNSRYRGNEFTSSQLAKKVMSALEVEKTRFPKIHRLVKESLRTWEEQGLCTHISCTKYSRCRKTKDTYRFNAQGIKEIKMYAIDETIKGIGEGELREFPIMRSRETIVSDRLEELLSGISLMDSQNVSEDAFSENPTSAE